MGKHRVLLLLRGHDLVGELDINFERELCNKRPPEGTGVSSLLSTILGRKDVSGLANLIDATSNSDLVPAATCHAGKWDGSNSV